MQEEMETYKVTVSVDLPKNEIEKILSLSPGILKQMCFRGILELLFKGTYPINGIDLSPDKNRDGRVNEL